MFGRGFLDPGRHGTRATAPVTPRIVNLANDVACGPIAGQTIRKRPHGAMRLGTRRAAANPSWMLAFVAAGSRAAPRLDYAGGLEVPSSIGAPTEEPCGIAAYRPCPVAGQESPQSPQTVSLGHLTTDPTTV
jgi:hypothetical protein